MGYYTNYSLSYYGSEEDKAAIEKYVPSNEDGYYVGANAMCVIIHDTDIELKWYDWEKDMEKLAAKFPNLLFVLCGNGEEFDDIWEYRIKNDKSEFHRVEMPRFTNPELQY